MKTSVLAITLAVGAFSLTACATVAPVGVATTEPEPNTTAASSTVRIASLKGPTTMGLVQLMSTDSSKDPSAAPATKYDFSIYSTPDEIVAKLDSIDIALIPANLAAVLYQKTNHAIQAAAVNNLGVLHVVTKGEKIAKLSDLQGKKVFATGKGTTPEYVLNYLLQKNNLDQKVKVEYLSEATEVAARLAGEKAGIAVLPEPYVSVVTSKDSNIKSVLDLNDEWAKVSPDSKIVTGLLVVKKQWAAENPAVFKTFLSDYQASADFTNTNPSEAGILIADAGLTPSPEIAQKAIPGAHLVCLAGAEAKAAISGYLQVLYDADPKSVGGMLPDADFYYTQQ